MCSRIDARNRRGPPQSLVPKCNRCETKLILYSLLALLQVSSHGPTSREKEFKLQSSGLNSRHPLTPPTGRLSPGVAQAAFKPKFPRTQTTGVAPQEGQPRQGRRGCVRRFRGCPPGAGSHPLSAPRNGLSPPAWPALGLPRPPAARPATRSPPTPDRFALLPTALV